MMTNAGPASFQPSERSARARSESLALRVPAGLGGAVSLAGVVREGRHSSAFPFSTEVIRSVAAAGVLLGFTELGGLNSPLQAGGDVAVVLALRARRGGLERLADQRRPSGSCLLIAGSS